MVDGWLVMSQCPMSPGEPNVNSRIGCWCHPPHQCPPGGHSITVVETGEEAFSCVLGEVLHQVELVAG
ncbi:hypothetical protein Hamer_G024682 [Homarus americanus]|uniref:Uncharacterized protein n=1 Tax=Homarus americanus TaxID=6706 RepID=A0A8J5K6B7_HOMAM|nr:hypothetical protein Hamer_G024682 [Homarus americanus]